MPVAAFAGHVPSRVVGTVLAVVALVALVQLGLVADSVPAASQPNTTFPDADGDGVRDEAEVDGDTDGDGIDNVADPDDDGDGIATADEGADPNGDALPGDATDSDGDNQPDFLDAAQVSNTDLTAPASSQRLAVDVPSGTRFGTPEAIGDVNGDGVVDLAVGAFSDDGAGEDAGAVWILIMSPDGTVADAHRVSAGVAGFEGALLEGGRFGFRVAGIGDLNSDGVPDMAVSAYRSDRAHTGAGEVWILFLNPDATVKDWQVITEGFGGLEADLREGDQFGVDVAGIGDLDGDGTNDLAVGMWKRDGLAEDDGGILVLFLQPDGKVKAYQEVSAVAGWADSPVGSGSGFGVSVDTVGDLNGDGVNDLIIGSIGVKSDRGKAWVMTMSADGTVAAATPLTPGRGAVPEVAAGGRFGSGIAGLGDVDGNGTVEVAIGAFGVDSFAGAAWVLELDSAGQVVGATDIEVEDVDQDDLFGHTIASLGDLNGDGALDLAIGTPGDDATGEGDGGVYLVQFGAGSDEHVDDEPDEAGQQAGEAPQPQQPNADVPADGSEEPALGAAEPDPEPSPEPAEPELDDGPDGDLDGDGLSNAIEGTGDIDADGIPNREDLDTDGDGIEDSIEGLADADGDGIANFVEIDDDGDGVLTIVEGTGDSDGDGIPNYLDPDVQPAAPVVEQPEPTEAEPTQEPTPEPDPDSDGDGIGDAVEGSGDSDGDGVPDQLDLDSDGDGIGDAVEGTVDSDGDGISDRLDLDSDGDGLSDSVEGSDDLDGDGLPNSLDTDSDGDGEPDAVEGAADRDNDGLPDYLDLQRSAAIMDLSIDAPDKLALGEVSEFTLSLVNQGPDVASETKAQMFIPAGLTVDPASAPTGCNVVGRLFTCDFGTLDVGQAASRTFTAEVLGEVRELEVKATVQANEGTTASSTGPVAVFDPTAVSQLTDGLRTNRAALVVVALTAVLGGAWVVMQTRQESSRRGA